MKNTTSESSRIFKTGYVLNDKWVIIEFIGKGAMGEVYRAHQLNLKRDVAIKVISRKMLESLEDDPKETESAIHRFRREVQAMARVRHPNVLQIFDYGSAIIQLESQDLRVEYIAMEYIPGATLRFTISEEGFYPESDLIAAWLSDYFLPLLDGVEAIHTKDIAHRDLKPENVLMDGKTPKIADFGLACSFCMQPVTLSLDVKGTPAYMSPEHFFEFKNADQQSDIYSLGKILYEAINGKISSKVLPFKSAALENPDTPFFKELDKIIQKATAEKKEDRPTSVDNLRTAVKEALNVLKTETASDAPAPPKPLPVLYQPRFIWAGIIIAVLSVAAMGIWHLLDEPGEKIVLLKTPETIQSKLPPAGTAGHATIKTQTSKAPEPSILGKDGMTEKFIPGGQLELKSKAPNDGQKSIRISPFYMDEKMVTNHHFAEFLNEMKDGLIIENGIVKTNNEIWFYLGEGDASNEPIIYKHGRFHLRDTEYAAKPVVRVTWYGASAYARNYGKRLLTETEWAYVASKDLIPGKKTDAKPPNNENLSSANPMHTHMMDMENLSNDNKSLTKGSENNLKAWSIQSNIDGINLYGNGSKENISYPSLVVTPSNNLGQAFKNFRYPWEAFEDVGFRCAINFGDEQS